MFKFINTLFNYCRLLHKINKYINNYNSTNEHNLEMIRNITENITSCGSVAIKFCQWVTPKLELMNINIDSDHKPEWLKLLEEYYENCPNHSFEYTELKYKNEFNENIGDIYRDITIIGSGSIGQVYRAYNEIEKRDEVIKIVHPNIDEEINIFRKIVNILFYVPCIKNKYNQLFPFDVYGFIDQFRDQIDLVKEANHNMYFHEKYKSNPYLIIPTLYRVNQHILIMSYEEGSLFDDSEISEYEKDKVANIFHLFIKSNVMFHNYNHGDMHPGNWKVRECPNGDNKLVVYDFGFCWRMPINKFTKIGNSFIETFEQSNKQDKETSIKSFSNILNFVILDNGQNYREKATQHIVDNIDNIEPWKISPIKLFRCTVDFCRSESLLIDPILIQIFIILIQGEKVFEKYNLMSTDTNTISDYVVFRERYLNILSFCKTYNIFNDFSNYIENKLNELQIDIDGIFDTIQIDESLLPSLTNLATQ